MIRAGAGGRPGSPVLLRLDPRIHAALQRWARDELRSLNAQVEFVLRRALLEAGRLGRGPDAERDRQRPRRR